MYSLSPFISIICSDSALICSSIILKNNIPFIEVQQQYMLEDYSIEGYLFNYSKVLHQLSTFISDHHLKNPIIALSLHNSSVKEEFHRTSYEKENTYNGYYWQEVQLEHDLFYRVGIKHEVLFQYHLLMFTGKLNVVVLTTPLMALISFHKKYNAHIPLPQCLSVKDLYSFVLKTAEASLYKDSFIQDRGILLEAVGLYSLARSIYETS